MKKLKYMSPESYLEANPKATLNDYVSYRKSLHDDVLKMEESIRKGVSKYGESIKSSLEGKYFIRIKKNNNEVFVSYVRKVTIDIDSRSFISDSITYRINNFDENYVSLSSPSISHTKSSYTFSSFEDIRDEFEEITKERYEELSLAIKDVISRSKNLYKSIKG